MITKKPWGYEEIIEQNQFYVIKKITVFKGHRLSLQYHEEKHETLFFRCGAGYMEIRNEGSFLINRVPFEYDRAYVVPPKTVHRIEAAHDADLVVMEVSTPQLSDVVRIEDDYGRE